MGKALGHEQHAPIGLGQDLADPLTKGWRTAPDIDRDIKDLALDHPDQLGLGLLDLPVQPAENPGSRAAMVVLHEAMRDAKAREGPFVIGFAEEAPVVTMDDWLKEADAWQGEIDAFHVRCAGSS